MRRGEEKADDDDEDEEEWAEGEVGVEDDPRDAENGEEEEDPKEALGRLSFSFAFFPEDLEDTFPVADQSAIGRLAVCFMSFLPDDVVVVVVVFSPPFPFFPSPPRPLFASPPISPRSTGSS